MPRFQRNDGYYSYQPRNLDRRYIVMKGDDGLWVVESHKTVNGHDAGLRTKFSDIPSKHDASDIVDMWIRIGR